MLRDVETRGPPPVLLLIVFLGVGSVLFLNRTFSSRLRLLIRLDLLISKPRDWPISTSLELDLQAHAIGVPLPPPPGAGSQPDCVSLLW